jgi:hypothetical protein
MEIPLEVLPSGAGEDGDGASNGIEYLLGPSPTRD